MTATSRPRTMIVPVTPQLTGELEATDRVMANLEREATRLRGGALNDKAHYATVVDTLEALTVATLSATSSVPLTARDVRPGARFDMGAGTPLAHHVNASVAYLQQTAVGLLANARDLTQYKGEHTDVAMGILKQLYGLLANGIIKQAEADLEAVKKRGAGALISAANRLAVLAKSPRHDPDAPQPAPEQGADVVDIREASTRNPDPR